MKISCKDVIPVLSAGEKLDPEMEAHVEHCPDCALFRKLCGMPAASEEIKVPESLDRAVLRSAHRRKAPGKWTILKFAVPAAASFAVCFSLLFFSMHPAAEPAGRALAVAPTSSWGISDFDENMIALSCDAEGGASAFNFYDSI